MRTAMTLAVALSVMSGSSADADAKPFRPFVDRVGVTVGGTIVTTTNATDQSDPPNLDRHQLAIFGADGTMVSGLNVEHAQRAGVVFTRPQWRALDRWIASLGLRRVEPHKLIELDCFPQPKPGEVACPANTEPLVRTTRGIGRWNPGNSDPIWAWGEPEVAEVADSCVLLLPDNKGSLDRTIAKVVPCPPIPNISTLPPSPP